MKMHVARLAALAVVVAVSAALAQSAAAATTSSSSALCTVARGVAKDIVDSTTIANGQALPGDVKATYEKVQAAEPSLIAAASHVQKTQLRQVFGFVNMLIADYKKANWSVAGLAPYAHVLIPRAAKVAKPMHSLKVYFDTTCKLNV